MAHPNAQQASQKYLMIHELTFLSQFAAGYTMDRDDEIAINWLKVMQLKM
jgi:hypothetical protein